MNVLTGVKFLSLEDELLIFNRKTADQGAFSVFLMAKTLGDVIDNYEFQFKIAKKLNKAPQFVEKVADIVLSVEQKDQVEGNSEVVTFESPKIEDPEGHLISIDISGAESITGVEIT